MMSVMVKSYKAIEMIQKGISYEALQGGSKMRQVVEASEIYKQKLDWARKFEKDKAEEAVIEEVISRMVWYLWVANKIAHALQYREEPILFADLTEEEFDPEQVDLKVLNEEARHLNYNIFTNDGHYFLSKEWNDLWNEILKVLSKANEGKAKLHYGSF